MMTRRLALAACGVLLGVTMAGSADAWGTARQTTYLTFSGPFALPGVSLPAGTYIFERADASTPDIIRVLSRNRDRVYLTAFTRPITRPKGLLSHNLVSFGEVPPGVPRPIRVWYPIGEPTGHQFLYDNQ
jgi:hypothetical protein